MSMYTSGATAVNIVYTFESRIIRNNNSDPDIINLFSVEFALDPEEYDDFDVNIKALRNNFDIDGSVDISDISNILTKQSIECVPKNDYYGTGIIAKFVITGIIRAFRGLAANVSISDHVADDIRGIDE